MLRANARTWAVVVLAAVLVACRSSQPPPQTAEVRVAAASATAVAPSLEEMAVPDFELELLTDRGTIATLSIVLDSAVDERVRDGLLRIAARGEPLFIRQFVPEVRLEVGKWSPLLPQLQRARRSLRRGSVGVGADARHALLLLWLSEDGESDYLPIGNVVRGLDQLSALVTFSSSGLSDSVRAVLRPLR